jgi:hypothetical protein
VLIEYLFLKKDILNFFDLNKSWKDQNEREKAKP